MPACHITQLERQDLVELEHTSYIILLFLLLFNTLGASANSGNVSATMQQTHALVNVMVCKG